MFLKDLDWVARATKKANTVFYNTKTCIHLGPIIWASDGHRIHRRKGPENTARAAIPEYMYRLEKGADVEIEWEEGLIRIKKMKWDTEAALTLGMQLDTEDLLEQLESTLSFSHKIPFTVTKTLLKNLRYLKKQKEQYVIEGIKLDPSYVLDAIVEQDYVQPEFQAGKDALAPVKIEFPGLQKWAIIMPMRY